MSIRIVAQGNLCYIEPKYFPPEQGGFERHRWTGFLRYILGFDYEFKAHDGAICYVSKKRLNDWLCKNGSRISKVSEIPRAIEEVFTNSKSGHWRKLGDEHQRRQRWQEAMNAYKKSLHVNPFNVSALLGKAICHRHLGNYHKAIENCTKGTLLAPFSSSPWACRGDSLRMLEEYDAAIDDLDKAIEINPNDDFALASKGDCLVQKRCLDQAEEYFKRALGINARNKFAEEGLCGIYLKKSEELIKNKGYKEAMEFASLASECEAGYSAASAILLKVYKSRGESRIDGGELQKAIQDLTEALKLDPLDEEILTLRGFAYGALGDHDRCISDCKKAMRINPANEKTKKHFCEYLLDEGLWAYNHENFMEAVTFYTEYLKINLNDIDVWYLRGLCFHALGMYEDMKLNYQKGLRWNSNNVKLRLLKAEACIYCQKFHQARGDLAKVLDQERNNGHVFLLIGTSYLFEKNYVKAQRNLSRAIQLLPNNSYAYRLRSLANYSLGNISASEKDCQKALAIEPDNDQFGELIKRIFRKNSQSYFSRFLSLFISTS